MHADAQVFINHKVFIISLTDIESGDKITEVMRLPAHIINFTTISALSKAAVNAEKESWDIEKIKYEVNRIYQIKHHPRLMVLLAVSIAGAGLCNLFGGDYISSLVVFAATFVGLFGKQLLAKNSFNPYIATFFGAFMAALISASLLLFFPTINPDIAIATSVLFTIPGVPLINSFTDLMDGYILTGFVRFMNGIIFVISIAFALFIVMYLFNIQSI
jgi:uncharacterized membrane protein YjjP (DUF1212 family)